MVLPLRPPAHPDIAATRRHPDHAYAVPVPRRGFAAAIAVPLLADLADDYAAQPRWCAVRWIAGPDGTPRTVYCGVSGSVIEDLESARLDSLDAIMSAAGHRGWGLAIAHAVDGHHIIAMWQHAARLAAGRYMLATPQHMRTLSPPHRREPPPPVTLAALLDAAGHEAVQTILRPDPLPAA